MYVCSLLDSPNSVIPNILANPGGKLGPHKGDPRSGIGHMEGPLSKQTNKKLANPAIPSEVKSLEVKSRNLSLFFFPCFPAL